MFSKHNFKGCKKAREFMRDIVHPPPNMQTHTHKRMSDLSELQLFGFTFEDFTFWL